jgi:hypothetical protein
LSFNFLHGIEQMLPYEASPIFSLLQEALYCEGRSSNWSAARIRNEFPEFEPLSGETVLFTGEMSFPWMFDVFPRLAPLREVAELLAVRQDWPVLYDESVLAANKVPIVAAVYAEDMYVERKFSEAVAEKVPNLHIWLTDEWDHNALRSDDEAVVFRRLLAMLGAQD